MNPGGRVVVVTGGARGIGRALARRFAKADAKAVIVADLDERMAATVAHQVGGHAVRCDVSVESDVKHLIEETESRHGPIGIFCSNAGIAVAGGPEAADEDWRRIWDVNVMAHVYVARHLIPRMVGRKEGYLLGTVSAAGLLNHVFAAPYGVTKAAALSLFEWLATAPAADAIRFWCWAPKGLRTNLRAKEGRTDSNS